MSSQARVRPSWKKNTKRAIKRRREIFERLVLKRIYDICDRNGCDSTAFFEGSTREINPNEYFLRP
jgi:hypothetical protein